MNNPSVHILMATYNAERYVDEQIESIVNQSYKDWTLTVSDDCSTDSTRNKISEWAQRDSRIILLEEHERFGSAKLNFTYLISNYGDGYTMLSDQDDVWLPEKITMTLEKMLKTEGQVGKSKPILVFTDMRVVSEDLSIIDESFERSSHLDPNRRSFQQLLSQNVGAGCTMMFNEKLVQIYSRVSSEAIDMMFMHDWWAMLISSAMGDIAYIDSPTSLYRQHDSNVVGAVKYSPLKRAFHFSEMVISIEKTIWQAKAFQSAYNGELTADKCKSLNHYLKILDKNRFLAIYCLARSHAWKFGARKVGQVVVTLFSNRRECLEQTFSTAFKDRTV